MTVRDAEAPIPTQTRRAHVALGTGALMFLNLVALYIELLRVLAHYDEHEVTDYLVPQDIWVPFIAVMLAQVAVNGLLLTVWKRTRMIGLGLLLAATLFLLALVVFHVLVVFPAIA